MVWTLLFVVFKFWAQYTDGKSHMLGSFSCTKIGNDCEIVTDSKIVKTKTWLCTHHEWNFVYLFEGLFMDSGFNTELHFWSKVSLDVEVKGRGCMCCSSQGELINWLSYVILCPFSYIILMTVFIFEVALIFCPIFTFGSSWFSMILNMFGVAFILWLSSDM